MCFDMLSDILPIFAPFWSKGESSVKIELSKTIYSIPDTIYIHVRTHAHCALSISRRLRRAAGRILMRKSNETRFKLNLIPPINKLRKPPTNCTRDIEKLSFHRVSPRDFLSIFSIASITLFLHEKERKDTIFHVS